MKLNAYKFMYTDRHKRVYLRVWCRIIGKSVSLTSFVISAAPYKMFNKDSVVCVDFNHNQT